MKDNRLNRISGKFMQIEPTIISSPVSIAATNTTTTAVAVPIGAYVTKVQVLATIAVSNADINVGDGSASDRYFDGLATLAQYDIVSSPNVASGTASDEVAGRYYAAADTIDVLTASGTAATPSLGSIKLLVSYFVL